MWAPTLAVARATAPSIEPLPTALGQDPDQINDNFSAANRGLDRARKLHVGPKRLDLPGLAGITDEIGTAHRDTQTVAARLRASARCAGREIPTRRRW